jgi:hypothetical protein
MSKNKTCKVIKKHSSDTAFDMEACIESIRRYLPNLDEWDTWIRSGIYIKDTFKKYISSYRLLGSQKPALGHSRIEVLMVKAQIGVQLSDAAAPCIDFISGHLAQSGTDAAYVILIPSTGAGWYFFFLASPKLHTITIPEDILKHICESSIKNYLKNVCGVSSNILDCYLSSGYALFDDSIIRSKAKDIDKALKNVKFCDIAAGSGQISRAMAALIARLRLDLNKYLGSSAERSGKRFAEHFFSDSLYATDCSAAALEILKTELRMELESEKAIKENHFVWGNVLIEDLFEGAKFDIAAANPPHMRQNEFSLIRDKLENYVSYRNNADLYCYYAEKAFNTVKEGGCASLLMSNRWMRSDYGAGLRGFLSGLNITEIIDYGNIPAVDEVVTPMSVVIGTNEPPSGKIRYTSVEDTDYENISLLVEENSIQYDSAGLGEDRWVFSSDEIGPLMDKIKRAGIPLGEYVNGKLYRGLLTGLNEAFAVDSAKAEELIKEDAASRKILHPFLSGRNVKRYAEPAIKKYLIFIPKGYTDKMRGQTEPWEWLSNTYPAIARHLLEFEHKASQRKDKGDYWWELRSCKYYDEFEKTKIICPTIVKQISATMDPSGLFSNDKTSIIASDDFYLLGLLNSRLMDFYFRRISTELLNGYYELKPANLTMLPIRRISSTNSFHMALRAEIEAGAMKLSELCSSKRSGQTEETSAQILETERSVNRAVYKLYKLTPKEIALVENN